VLPTFTVRDSVVAFTVANDAVTPVGTPDTARLTLPVRPTWLMTLILIREL